jgi:hypothetical protein
MKNILQAVITRLTLGGKSTLALIAGCGTAAATFVTGKANTNFFGAWLTSSAATGTNRGVYLRQYLTGGAGGEAARIFNTCSSDAPVDTVNGAHITQSFGATAGNTTGEAQAIRGTLQIPNRTLTGTCAAVKAEIVADGASSSASNTAFIRCTVGGNSTGVTALDTALKFAIIDGVGAAGAGKILQANTAAASSHILKISIDGVAYGIMVVAL